jgi:hypothetical protein
LHDFIVIILIDSSISTSSNLINFSFIYFIAAIECNLYIINFNIYLDNDYFSIMQAFSQIIMISFIFTFDIFLVLIGIFIMFLFFHLPAFYNNSLTQSINYNYLNLHELLIVLLKLALILAYFTF